jgi:hypothetical protein|tara:strand:+ start:2606 stop:3235 length:630 start_codon:yes stop_codon:yes gene_type:complete
MPKAFDSFDDKKTIKDTVAKREYNVRQFVQTDKMIEPDKVQDAEDIEVRDFTFQAGSYPEAMGLMLGDMVQNYAYNMCVKMLQTFHEWFEQSGQVLTDEKALELLRSEGIITDEDDIEEIKDKVKNKWHEVMIPAGFAVDVLAKVVANFRDMDNLLFWQEPELIIMGNPNLVQNMNITAETLDDKAKDGVKDIEKFLVNFTSKKSEEEE